MPGTPYPPVQRPRLRGDDEEDDDDVVVGDAAGAWTKSTTPWKARVGPVKTARCRRRYCCHCPRSTCGGTAADDAAVAGAGSRRSGRPA